MPNGAVALFEKNSYFLDHLIHYCHLFGMPLITNDIALSIEAENFYPECRMIISEEIEEYDALFYGSPYKCFPSGFHFPTFFTPSKKRSYCTLHGTSEKYLDEFWLERLVDEDVVLLQGQFYIDILKAKGVYERLRKPLLCGNLRYLFYLQERPFFTKKIAHFVPQERGERTILWAPTWNAQEPQAFFRQAALILPQLPQKWQMLIKLHPLILRNFSQECALFEHDFPSITFFKDIPLIYPLLDYIDFFLGDGSSISYDFLAFNKPLFFLEEKKKKIHQGGRVISPDEYGKIFNIMAKEESPDLAQRRTELYRYFFAPDISIEWLKQQL